MARINLQHEHQWAVGPAEARAIQEDLRGWVETTDRLGAIRCVAGVDVGIDKRAGLARAAVVVLSWPGLALEAQSAATEPVRFPYVPGLLSFREVPVVLSALAGLKRLPDLLLCDGQGYAHPRRFGIACHLGVLLDLPSIGVAKKRLLGEHREVPDTRGSWVPLEHGGDLVGAVLRTRPGVKPVYVSVGHRIGLETAIEYVMGCTTRYRLPETTRAAHRLASGTW